MGGKGNRNKKKGNKNEHQQRKEEETHTNIIDEQHIEKPQSKQQVRSQTLEVIDSLSQNPKIQENMINTIKHENLNFADDKNSQGDSAVSNIVNKENNIGIKEGQQDQKFIQEKTIDINGAAEYPRPIEETPASAQSSKTRQQISEQSVISESKEGLEPKDKPLEKQQQTKPEKREEESNQNQLFKEQTEAIQLKDNFNDIEKQKPSQESQSSEIVSHPINLPEAKQQEQEISNSQGLYIINEQTQARQTLADKPLKQQKQVQLSVNQEQNKLPEVQLAKDGSYPYKNEVVQPQAQHEPESTQQFDVLQSANLSQQPQQILATNVLEAEIEGIPSTEIDDNPVFNMQQSLQPDVIDPPLQTIDSNLDKPIVIHEPKFSGEPEISHCSPSQTQDSARDKNMHNQQLYKEERQIQERQEQEQKEQHERESVGPFVTFKIPSNINENEHEESKPWEVRRDEELSQVLDSNAKGIVEEEISDRQTQQDASRIARNQEMKTMIQRTQKDPKKDIKDERQVNQKNSLRKIGISLVLSIVLSGALWFGTKEKKYTALIAIGSFVGSFALQK